MTQARGPMSPEAELDPSMVASLDDLLKNVLSTPEILEALEAARLNRHELMGQILRDRSFRARASSMYEPVEKRRQQLREHRARKPSWGLQDWQPGRRHWLVVLAAGLLPPVAIGVLFGVIWSAPLWVCFGLVAVAYWAELRVPAAFGAGESATGHLGTAAMGAPTASVAARCSRPAVSVEANRPG
ncbi:hypothetical protein SAMN04487819_1228 [Actinopolyspora alba]|uniref:Uncharacterized protein n=1 Tax=Actinopolyspora alba TaxID=673379 RepID=A0A1I2CHJ0_9ACTN|nr:hypothetical protein [Actinopolyspora alba]SFE67612.1 hypothetical protein SAMN04487819_1228 [Actinopolyspora alba]